MAISTLTHSTITSHPHLPRSKTATMASFVDLMSSCYTPVQSSILSYLSAPDVVMVTRTCRSLSTLWKTFVATQFDINTRLSHFFKDPRHFRIIQSQTDAVIIHEWARCFFERPECEYNELTIGIAEKHVLTLATYLKHEGYVCDKTDLQQYITTGSYWDAEKYLLFTKTTEYGNDRTIGIDWGVNGLRPILSVGGDRCTTADLSFITWNKAFCLFPSATLQHRVSYLIGPLAECTPLGLADLGADGIKTMSVAWESIAPSADCHKITDLRRIGDNQTLIVELNVDDIVPSEKPDSVIESATFKLCLYDEGYNYENDKRVKHYVLEVKKLSYDILKYDYFVRYNKYDRDSSWYTKLCNELRTRLEELTIMELMKMPSDDRPPQYDELWSGEIKAKTFRGSFTLPSTWTFYDNEVIAFLAMAWENRDMAD
jgi:hypothetical protein